MPRKQRSDFIFRNHGSICTLEPRTRRGFAWADENIQGEFMKWGHEEIVIEPRYVDPIIAGIFGDGLTVA